jgi:transcriptional regulator with XRE-family HTH domain
MIPRKNLTFAELLQRRGVGPSWLARTAKVGRSSVHRWCKGLAKPRNAQAAAIAAVLQIPVEEVLQTVSNSG